MITLKGGVREKIKTNALWLSNHERLHVQQIERFVRNLEIP